MKQFTLRFLLLTTLVTLALTLVQIPQAVWALRTGYVGLLAQQAEQAEVKRNAAVAKAIADATKAVADKQAEIDKLKAAGSGPVVK